MEASPTKDGYGCRSGNPIWQWKYYPTVGVTAFSDGAAMAGCAVMLGSLLGDAELWQAVLQQMAASRPCLVSQGRGSYLKQAKALPDPGMGGSM